MKTIKYECVSGLLQGDIVSHKNLGKYTDRNGMEEGRSDLVIYVQPLLYDSANQFHSVKGQYFILQPSYERKRFLP